jgi:hypothetical protein
MMKKNISLCALMMLLITGLHASDSGSSSDGDYVVVNSRSFRGLPKSGAGNDLLLTAENLARNSGSSQGTQFASSYDSVQPRYSSAGGFEPHYSYSDTSSETSEGSDAAEQDIRATEQSKNIIARSFQSLDTWIGENIIKTEINSQSRLITSVSLPASQNKMRIIEAKINEAFKLLDSATNNGYTTPVKDAVMRAVRTFSQESNIDNKVLKGIVDSAKIALLAPIKLAVKIGAVSIGAGTVAAGNTVAALGAGINRTANRISKANSEVLNSKNNIVLKAVKIFVYTTCITLDGILATADLMAFSAAEGVVIGGVAGYGASTKRVGKVVGLDKNPAIDKRRAEEAQAKQAEGNQALDLLDAETIANVKNTLPSAAGSASLENSFESGNQPQEKSSSAQEQSSLGGSTENRFILVQSPKQAAPTQKTEAEWQAQLEQLTAQEQARKSWFSWGASKSTSSPETQSAQTTGNSKSVATGRL